MTKHHRFLLALHIKQTEVLDEAIVGINQEFDAHVEPSRAAITQLTTIPGIGDLPACVILAEIGSNMTRLPTQGHLISWAGL